VYYRQQRRLLASTARLERLLIGRHERDPRGFAALAPRYERSHRPLLPWWALLASNSHKLGVALAAFIPVRGGGFWEGLGVGWYLVYGVALNLVMVPLLVAQGRVDERFSAELAAAGGGA
jgi:hypothetical protein